MATELRAGVVGVGHLGRHHARLYAAAPGVRLVGIVDADAARADEIAAQYGARRFPDVNALAEEVDLVSIATPTTVHEPTAAPFLERGVAALVEKPLAPDAAAGRRLVELARRTGAPLMVGHTERFHPAVATLRERAHQPRFIEVHRLAPFVARGTDVDVVLDLMIHDLDLCRFLAGPQEIEVADARGIAVLTGKIDIATVRLRIAGGAGANLTASRVSAERMRRIRLFDRDTYYACDTGAGTLTALRAQRDGSAPPSLEREEIALPAGEPLGREIAAFVEAVRHGTPPPCSGEDGLAALTLALRVVEEIERRG